jgi:hypothetical protein
MIDETGDFPSIADINWKQCKKKRRRRRRKCKMYCPINYFVTWAKSLVKETISGCIHKLHRLSPLCQPGQFS